MVTFLSDKLAEDTKVRCVPHNASDMLIFLNPAVFVPQTGNGKWAEDEGGDVTAGDM